MFPAHEMTQYGGSHENFESFEYNPESYESFEAASFEGLGEGAYGENPYGEGPYGEGAYGEGPYGEGTYGEGAYGEGGYGEADPFIGRWVRRGVRSLAKGGLKGLVRKAAALAGGAIGGPAGAALANTIAGQVIRESQFEGDPEGIYETDPETDLREMGASPHLLAEMQHLATMAANAETQQEADHFIGALAGLAGRILPQVLGGFVGGGDGEGGYFESGYQPETYQEFSPESYYEGGLGEGDQFLPLAALAPLAMQFLPQAASLVSRGVQAAGRFLSSPGVRRAAGNATRAMGSAAANIVRNVATSVQGGAPLNRNTIIRGVAGGVAQTMGSPQRYRRAVVRNHAYWRRQCTMRGYAPRRLPAPPMGMYRR